VAKIRTKNNKLEKILPKIESIVLINKIMKSPPYFFNGKDLPNLFCKERDIDRLPLNETSKEYMFFDKISQKFKKNKIGVKDSISSKENISDFIKKTRKKDILFVFKNKKIVGVIHFSDLISSIGYIYFYTMINLFETALRKKLVLQKNNNEDFLKYLQKKGIENKTKIERYEEHFEKENLPPFQQLEFLDLIKFADNKKIIYFGKISNKKIKEKINCLRLFRNNIMHNKDMFSRQNEDFLANEMLYKREDYDKFLEAYDIINKFIKELD